MKYSILFLILFTMGCSQVYEKIDHQTLYSQERKYSSWEIRTYIPYNFSGITSASWLHMRFDIHFLPLKNAPSERYPFQFQIWQEGISDSYSTLRDKQVQLYQKKFWNWFNALEYSCATINSSADWTNLESLWSLEEGFSLSQNIERDWNQLPYIASVVHGDSSGELIPLYEASGWYFRWNIVTQWGKEKAHHTTFSTTDCSMVEDDIAGYDIAIPKLSRDIKTKFTFTFSNPKWKSMYSASINTETGAISIPVQTWNSYDKAIDTFVCTYEECVLRMEGKIEGLSIRFR